MSDDLVKLISRSTVSVLMLFHGVHKLLDGIEPIKSSVASHHLPLTLSYGVYLGELAGPLLVLLGFFSRVGGALIVVNMLFALYLVQLHSLFALNSEGGYALETDVFYLIGGLCVILSGAGRYGLGGDTGPLN